MAAIIKIFLKEEKPRPIFVNDDENKCSIDDIFNLFITTKEKTVFFLPEWVEKYIVYYNGGDNHSDDIFVNSNQAKNIILENSIYMLIAYPYKNKDIFYSKKSIDSILVKHDEDASINAFRSIYQNLKIC